jgi:hypothetical protein
MELRERNHRSRFERRSTKSKREGVEDNDKRRPLTDRERFSVTRNYEKPSFELGHQVKKWAPLVILAAIIWYLVQSFAL